MIHIIPALLFSCTLTPASFPISYYTLSNPAFTLYEGDYQVVIEPKGIGDIAVFNCGARFRTWGMAFSNLRAETERKNWLSFAYHFNTIPLSLGANLGINERANENRNLLCDIGLWYRRDLQFGFNYSNLLENNRVLRAGLSYTLNRFTGTLELEDSTSRQKLIPHILLGVAQPVANFIIQLSGGYHSERFVAELSVKFRDFIKWQLLFEEETKLLLEVNFSPPVIVKEVTVLETLLVEQPIVVKKTTTIEKIPKGKVKDKKTPSSLSEKEKKYCETHYLKGIECYLNNELEQAIKEWNAVIKVDPDYKDVKRYLENARAKLKLLKE